MPFDTPLLRTEGILNKYSNGSYTNVQYSCLLVYWCAVVKVRVDSVPMTVAVLVRIKMIVFWSCD